MHLHKMSKSAYATDWYHNDNAKPHSYYSRERIPLRMKNKGVADAQNFSGHPFSSLSANIMVSDNNKTLEGIV